MNICQNCKTENNTDSKFCKNCGSEIVIETTEIDIENKEVLTSLETNSSSEEIPKQNKAKNLFLFTKNKVKKFIFFLSKNNIVTIVTIISISPNCLKISK